MKHRLTVEWESETEVDKLDSQEYGWAVRLAIRQVIKGLIDHRVDHLDSVVMEQDAVSELTIGAWYARRRAKGNEDGS